MPDYSTIETSPGAYGALTIWLNRPQVRNAFDDVMIHEINAVLAESDRNPDVRLLVLRGKGPVFSSGADLDWYARMGETTKEANLLDSRAFAGFLDRMDRYPKPIIGAAHGTVVGGAIGLLATCDIVIASIETTFRFPEARLGLVPATIAPFVLSKIGLAHARYLFLTGRQFDAARARELRLVHEIVGTPADLDAAVEVLAADISQGSPLSYKTTKSLLRRLTFHGHSMLSSDTLDDVATLLAEIRTSEEAEEGIRAFREHRPPSWTWKGPHDRPDKS
jgi:methylglutaconyl-CoA hydratase